MHTVAALLCFVVVIHWLIFPYPSGLLHWHCGNLTIAPVPAKQPWWIWIHTSCEFIMNDCITTTKQSTTKPCAYFLGYTVHSMYSDRQFCIGTVPADEASTSEAITSTGTITNRCGSYLWSGQATEIISFQEIKDHNISCKACIHWARSCLAARVDEITKPQHMGLRIIQLLRCLSCIAAEIPVRLSNIVLHQISQIPDILRYRCEWLHHLGDQRPWFSTLNKRYIQFKTLPGRFIDF